MGVPERKRTRPARRRGATVVYAAVTFVALMGIAMLGLDWGYLSISRDELKRAADAAAMAAVQQAGNATAMESAAVTVASQNLVAGTPLVLLPGAGDVEIGTWDPTNRTFAPLAGAARDLGNAARVTARRTAARGTALRLFLSGFFGTPTSDMTASSIALSKPTGYGMVGLDSLTMSGNASGVYRSDGGSTSAASKGSIGSNGNITLSGSTMIQGDAIPGVGGSVVGGAGRVSGSMTPRTKPLVYPVALAGPYKTTNDNASVGLDAYGDVVLSGTQTVTAPGGNYYVRNLSIGPNVTVNLTGPVTLWVYGNLEIRGITTAAANVPANLKINMIEHSPGSGAGSVLITSSAAFRAVIYAPKSPVTISGSGNLYGSVVGKSISMSGTSSIYYDAVLDTGGGTTLVR